MKITKEIAYLYLKHCKTLGEYTDFFIITGIYTDDTIPGVNTHPVIKCEYSVEDTNYIRHIHIDLGKFKDWIKVHRNNLLNELGI
jgi:hypothetical protein